MALACGCGAVWAQEVFRYDVELRSPVTLYSWADMGTGTVTTREAPCPSKEGECKETSVFMTSERSKLLESTYPLRYLYRTAYRFDNRSTQAWEELRRKRDKEASAGYQWRHRVIWLVDVKDGGMRYDFDETGHAIPTPVASWITKDKAEGYPLKAKSERKVPTRGAALDRWGALQLVRTLEMKEGEKTSLAGQGSKGPIAFDVVVEKREKLDLAGRVRDTWKVRIDEKSLLNKDGDKDSKLYVWVADDATRTPVKFEMEHDIGRLRFSLATP